MSESTPSVNDMLADLQREGEALVVRLTDLPLSQRTTLSAVMEFMDGFRELLSEVGIATILDGEVVDEVYDAAWEVHARLQEVLKVAEGSGCAG